MDTYTVTFTVPPAIVVRGRGVDSKQQILRTSVSRAGAINELWHRTVGGNFEIGGVPKSTDSWFFVARVASPMSKTIRLTTLQTAADVDLGNVVLPAAAGNTPVSLTCTGLDTVLEDDGLQRTYITLVGADASHVYSCAIGEAGLAQSEESGDQPLLPAGRYYVVPGLFCTSRSVHRLLDLLHAGKQASVDALGVPVIDAIPNQAITATVNVADAQDRIAGIRD
jgi:hypothetical protein